MPRKFCNPCYRPQRRRSFDHCDNYCRRPCYYYQPLPPGPTPPPIGLQAHLVLEGEYDVTSTLVTFSLFNDGEIPAAGTVVTISNNGSVILDPADISVPLGTTVAVDPVTGNITWTIGNLPVGTAIDALELQFLQDALPGQFTFEGVATTSSLNNPDQSTASVIIEGDVEDEAALIVASVWDEDLEVAAFDIVNGGDADAEDVVLVITPDPFILLDIADIDVTQGTVDVNNVTGEITWNVGTVATTVSAGDIMISFPQVDPSPDIQEYDAVATTTTPNDDTGSSNTLVIPGL